MRAARLPGAAARGSIDKADIIGPVILVPSAAAAERLNKALASFFAGAPLRAVATPDLGKPGTLMVRFTEALSGLQLPCDVSGIPPGMAPDVICERLLQVAPVVVHATLIRAGFAAALKQEEELLAHVGAADAIADWAARCRAVLADERRVSEDAVVSIPPER